MSLLVVHHARNFRCGRPLSAKTAETKLLGQLVARIRLKGPLTIADYMKEVLINPTAGYYMNKDVFGSKGDFITSPEISQMFGELIGIWCVNEWLQCGSPPSLQVVEFGPGRGTLADDMLRVFSRFPVLKEIVSLHCVEISPKLSEIQFERLAGTGVENPKPIEGNYYRHCISRHGFLVKWFRHFNDVPQGFSFFLAHEFFDALPIHAFQKHNGIWHEVLVDVDDSESGSHHLRFVLSPSPSAASLLLLNVEEGDSRDRLELCPEAGVLVDEICLRISKHGGFALLADYGHCGEKGDTFRAFRNHELCDPLAEPGMADLTADVDFSYLKKMAGKKVCVHGPETQEKFLHNMGIGVRLQALLGNASTEQRQNLMTSYDLLTNPIEMGKRFKFLALLSADRTNYVPSGFKTLS